MRRGDFEAAKSMLQDGVIYRAADVNVKTSDGVAAIHRAVMDYTEGKTDKPEVLNRLKFLIENGVDVNAKNEDGETPFDVVIGSFCYIFDTRSAQITDTKWS
jgi:ankyrin repeat protein